LKPTLRELRQTLAAYRASYGEAVDRIWITGGGSRLAGLPEYLGEELGLPVAPLPWPEREGFPTGSTVVQQRELLPVAVGLALAAGQQVPHVNFRRGEYAYRSDFSFLRAKALRVGVA